jgi:dipeptidyl aminopeptidase/acylaminoacyl peptidase
MKTFFVILFTGFSLQLFSQQTIQTLSVEKIMRDQKWIGSSPSNPYWSHDGSTLYFNWNPTQAWSDSLYYITRSDVNPKKTTATIREDIIAANNITYNSKRSAFAVVRDGDIYVTDAKSGKSRRITETVETETNPQFIENDGRIIYTRNQNIFAFDLNNGLTRQLTNFQRTNPPASRTTGEASRNRQEAWLEQDQLNTFEVLKSRKAKREAGLAALRAAPAKKGLRTIHIGDRFLSGLTVSPDGRFITYRLSTPPPPSKSTIVPNYVTESGFTTDIPGRTKVGAPEGTASFYIFDSRQDTILTIKTQDIPGIRDLPDYVKDYPRKDSSSPATRAFNISGPYWNETGNLAVLELRSTDNKDRWIMALDATTGKLKLLDRQRDEAWIGGPGISSFGVNGSRWIDAQHYWFQSEATGYSHLYKVNVATGEKSALTKGSFEVQSAQLSADRNFFYITTNQVHPGEQHFYRLPVNGGQPEQITKLTGAHQVTISPDEKQLAILYSYINKPWELYIQPNKPGSEWKQVTFAGQSAEFASYKWREPEVMSFTARDGAKVFARLYKPSQPAPGNPAVIFVHGAGYLQNAHKWWSQYSREYMFNNLLAEKGYTVMDIDYRGSAGYGRDWRTGIYRHMGGKDLADHVDAAKYMVDHLGVDPKRIGIYGGSYGGFITLMAMFTEPEVFAAGAALRSVTDWAHYNHGYTSNILNEPFADSIAYNKSSPIYYANGLKGHLLMCHGMVDVNVHFQDIVRLSQRLIELGKDNWELAVYPVEDHAFVEPSSWTDEYKRVLKLFETVLKRNTVPTTPALHSGKPE